MTGTVSKIDWTQLHHAFGPAADIPRLLEDLQRPESKSRDNAMRRLWSCLYHQADSWEASEHVLPILVELATSNTVADRHEIVRLIEGMAIADTTPEMIPIDFETAFARARRIDALDEAMVRQIVRKFYEGDDIEDADLDTKILNDLPCYWARNTFLAAQRSLDAVLRLLTDKDERVAAAVAKLLIWFPKHAASSTLSIIQAFAPARSRYACNAGIALGYLGKYEFHLDAIESRLTASVKSDSCLERLGAAIGLGICFGPAAPDATLDPLLEL